MSIREREEEGQEKRHWGHPTNTHFDVREVRYSFPDDKLVDPQTGEIIEFPKVDDPEQLEGQQGIVARLRQMNKGEAGRFFIVSWWDDYKTPGSSNPWAKGAMIPGGRNGLDVEIGFGNGLVYGICEDERLGLVGQYDWLIRGDYVRGAGGLAESRELQALVYWRNKRPPAQASS